MIEKFISNLVSEAREQFSSAIDKKALENAKAKFLGKNGEVNKVFKGLSKIDTHRKRYTGELANQAKREIEILLSQRCKELDNARINDKLNNETIDVTLPGRGSSSGNTHPIMQTCERVELIFQSIGFTVLDGPEIENDWTNFTALNSPSEHPARSMHDTFYIDLNDAQGLPLLLRTHTSSMQVRYSRLHNPPIKIIAPGRTFRVDNDATHSPMFYQVEGLWIDKDVSFTDLKRVYTDFLCCFFEDNNLAVRFRPSFFPFTEPSAEVDVQFTSGPNQGRWLEISGAGQVHPKVLENFGLDPENYIGFAFGSGIDRLTMLRYGVNDLRHFYEGDIRFLSQFNQ